MTASKWIPIDSNLDSLLAADPAAAEPALDLMPIVTKVTGGEGEGEAVPGAEGAEVQVPIPDTLAILPLRNVVVYPLTAIPLSVGQPRSVKLVDDATVGQRIIGLVAAKNPQLEAPGPDDLYRVGTAVAVHRLFRAPDGTIRLLVQGLMRFRLTEFVETEPYLKARIEPAPETIETGLEVEALMRTVSEQFQRMTELAPSIPSELLAAVLNVEDPRQLVYTVATYQRMDLAD